MFDNYCWFQTVPNFFLTPKYTLHWGQSERKVDVVLTLPLSKEIIQSVYYDSWVRRRIRLESRPSKIANIFQLQKIQN